jgi:hypothetical protein
MDHPEAEGKIMSMMEFKLVIDLRDKPEEDHQAIVARLLRNAAGRIETGSSFGGFAFDKDDRTPGGFSFRPIKGKR